MDEDNNFLAMLQSTVPLSPSESSHSSPQPRHPFSGEPTSKPVVVEEDSDEDAPQHEQQHADGPSSEKSSSERESVGGQDNTSRRKRMEQNRAAQRAFRERRERRMAELTAQLYDILARKTADREAIRAKYADWRVPDPRPTSEHTGAFASPASTGLDNPFGPLTTFERQQIYPDVERLSRLYGYQTMEHDSVPFKRDFSRPGLSPSYGQTQPPVITSAGRHALGFEAFNDTSPLPLNASRPDPYANSEVPGVDNYMTDWTTYPSSSRPTSHLRAASTHIRMRTTHRNQHHQYMDSLLRSKCPKTRAHALDMIIQFRDEHGTDEPIPNNLLDELLESTGDGKYIFCCQRGQKPRNITGARDNVRKALGNFPFRCSNLGCQHSSLRQADRNKHMKICKFPASTFSLNVDWGFQNLESSAPSLSASTSLTPQEQNTAVDTDALLDITNAGEDVMDKYLAFPPLGGEYEAGIDGAE